MNKLKIIKDADFYEDYVKIFIKELEKKLTNSNTKPFSITLSCDKKQIVVKKR